LLKPKGLWFGLAVACVLLCRCGEKDATVIATVNGAELTLEDLYAEIPKDYLDSVTPEQKLEFIERWINGEVLYQEALRRGLQREAQIREKIRAVEKNILIAELVQQELQNRVQVVEEEAREYYEAHSDDYTREADEVRTAQILVPTLEEARKIRQEIEAGGDFAHLAREHSVDPTAENGGDLGYFPREDLLSEVAKAAFSLSPGALSQPVKTEFGYHLITVIDKKKKGSVRAFDLVKEEIIAQFSAKQEIEQLELFLDELKENSSIKQHLEILSVSPPPAENTPISSQENY
jgi:parvulin-like peptidyl-prolyl isomerase